MPPSSETRRFDPGVARKIEGIGGNGATIQPGDPGGPGSAPRKEHDV